MKLQWAGGVRRKTEEEGTGVVESVQVGTIDARPVKLPPRRAEVVKSTVESGAFAEVRMMRSGPEPRATPTGRFRLPRND